MTNNKAHFFVVVPVFDVPVNVHAEETQDFWSENVLLSNVIGEVVRWVLLLEFCKSQHTSNCACLSGSWLGNSCQVECDNSVRNVRELVAVSGLGEQILVRRSKTLVNSRESFPSI